jgi:hypothetical protein
MLSIIETHKSFIYTQFKTINIEKNHINYFIGWIYSIISKQTQNIRK